jgi:predicted RNA-binding Zn-ribbon protein involved in translation (DUF1610 family)
MNDVNSTPDSEDPNRPSGSLACPECGGSLTQVGALEFDEVGPRRVDFECPNGHHVEVQRIEVNAEDNDVEYRDPDV